MPATASDELARIAAALREAGDRGNTNALRRGLRAAANPMVSAVHQAALEQLPKAGGLNKQVASQKVSVRTRLSARTADVRLTTTAPDTAMTDSGFVRHPIFGRRGKGQWRRQSIPQAVGWWTNTLNAQTGKVRAALEVELERVATLIRGV